MRAVERCYPIARDVAAARLDPPERARAYAEVALELLREAEAELARGDLRQTSEEV